jgi:hypothetical protein
MSTNQKIITFLFKNLLFIYSRKKTSSQFDKDFINGENT